MEFGILGPLEARTASGPVALGGIKPRIVLSLLLLHRNEPVQPERLAMALWGQDAPASAVKSVQVYVSRLRKAFEDPDVLIGTQAGYRLRVRSGELDAERFDRLVDDGRRALERGDPEHAAAVLREALALWRGPPLAELVFEPSVQAEIARLQEQRLTAVELRVDADLSAGRHGSLVGVLRQLVSTNPTRERFVEQLMLALYRCGQQIEALEVYRRTRRLLADELAIEPGPSLVALERAILLHDRSLLPAPQGGPDLPDPSRSRLPTPAARLIGRENDVESTTAMLRRADMRLLTLTGTGGVGKTRLALEVAQTVKDDFADGAYFVALASISDPKLVADAIVRGLGHVVPAEKPALQVAQHVLRGRQILVVLDNFEHVITAASDIATLLGSCPGLVAVVTSREPLRISGEHTYEVSGLALPVPGGHPRIRDLERSAAVTLFADRANAADPSFRLTAKNSHAVAQICVRLDGLPLAIELAAARAGLFEPQQLVNRLERRLSFLTLGARDAEPRHRTLRAAIDWSYALLDSDEQAAFTALAVFVGGATLDAALAVAGSSPDTIESLIAKNMIVRRRMADGQPRLFFLETIREYAVEELCARVDADVVRRRHCNYYVSLAELGADELWGREQMTWMATFDTEADNLRAAVEWSRSAGEPQLGLRIATAAMENWGQRRQPQEVATWIKTLLQEAADLPDDLHGLAGTLLGLVDDRAIAASHARRALPLVRASGNARATCWCLQAIVVDDGLEHSAARELAAQALDVARGSGDLGAVAIALEIAVIAAESFTEAKHYFDEASFGLRARGDRLVLATLLHNMGCVSVEHQEDALAAKLLDEAIELARQTEDVGLLPYALAIRGQLLLLHDDVEPARAMLREAVLRCQQVQLSLPASEAIFGLGMIAAHDGSLDRAAMLCAASSALRDHLPLQTHEQRLHARHIDPVCATAAGAAKWAAGLARAAHLDPDHAYEQALKAHPVPAAQSATAS